MSLHAAIPDLEIGLLRTFVLVIHHGSIGKAAEAIDMTQPAVSQRLIKLERIVGHKLFDRGRNGLSLTTHGEMLMSHAHSAIQLSEEALGRLRGTSVRKQVSLGTSADVALAGLVPALRRLQSIHLDLELRVVVTAPARLDTLLRNRQLDLVIASPKLMTTSPSITWPVPLHWTSHRNLPIDRSLPLPLVLFENPCAWQDEMLESLLKAHWEWRVTFQSSSLDAIVAAARSGLGMAVLPREIMHNSKLVRVDKLGLPPAPHLEFGLFPATGLASEARTLFEVAMGSVCAKLGSQDQVTSRTFVSRRPRSQRGHGDTHGSKAVAESTSFTLENFA